jgi:hypothetical protein
VRPEGLGKFKKSPLRVWNPGPSGLSHSATAIAICVISLPTFLGGVRNFFYLQDLTICGASKWQALGNGLILYT